MNKYLMKTINYKGWKIELYQWFARRRYEIVCYGPNGSYVDSSRICLRCWFREEYAIDDAKEFIDSVTSQQNYNSVLTAA